MHVLMPSSIAWLIVADAGRCRALEERRPGAELRELIFWDRRQTVEDRRQAHHQKAVEHRRLAAADLRNLEEQAERRFLARYANQLNLAGAKGRYERLVLIAPPRTLGVLRGQLGRTAERRVERTDVCDCVGETPEALRLRLRALRAAR